LGPFRLFTGRICHLGQEKLPGGGGMWSRTTTPITQQGVWDGAGRGPAGLLFLPPEPFWGNLSLFLRSQAPTARARFPRLAHWPLYGDFQYFTQGNQNFPETPIPTVFTCTVIFSFDTKFACKKPTALQRTVYNQYKVLNDPRRSFLIGSKQASF